MGPPEPAVINIDLQAEYALTRIVVQPFINQGVATSKGTVFTVLNSSNVVVYTGTFGTQSTITFDVNKSGRYLKFINNAGSDPSNPTVALIGINNIQVFNTVPSAQRTKWYKRVASRASRLTRRSQNHK